MKIISKLIGAVLGATMALGVGIGIGGGHKTEVIKAEAADLTANFTLSDANEKTVDGITVSFAKASGSNSPAWYSAGLRLYANNTVTISTDSNTITGITFNGEKQGSKPFADCIANTGTYTHPSAAGNGIGVGNASNIIFTLGTSGQLQLNTFSVSYSGSGGDTPVDPPTPISNNYTLDGTATGGTNGYATESDITQNNISGKVMGNTTMNPWRIGGKSLTNENRTIYSTTALEKEIYQIEITHGTAADVTINSLTVTIASDANFTNIISTLTPTFAVSETITVVRPADTSWNNAYYKFTYNITISVTSNKFLQFIGATFYAEQAIENTAEIFATTFLANITCDATGLTAPVFTKTWTELETLYGQLDSTEQGILQSANVDENGTVIEQAMARYNYLVAKYHYTDFIGRNPAPLASNRLLQNQQVYIPVIATVAVLGIVASLCAAYFIFKKKKLA